MAWCGETIRCKSFVGSCQCEEGFLYHLLCEQPRRAIIKQWHWWSQANDPNPA